MNPKKLLFSLLFPFGLALAGGLLAQPPGSTDIQKTLPIRFPDLPPASPICTNIQHFGFTQIEIVYSRPSMGRHTVFGGIVPYNELWRTGDNASTKISFSTPVKLGGNDGVELPAGKYALFTIPDEKAWTVIFNKDTSGWGKENYDDSKDVARFKVAPLALKDAVETFTIDLNDIQDDSATINLTWARTRVPIKVQVDIVSDLLVVIQASMDSPVSSSRQFISRRRVLLRPHQGPRRGIGMGQCRDW